MPQEAVKAKKGLTPQYWLSALYTMPKFNADAPPDALTRWLVASRAAVVIMSVISGLLGGLLVLVGATEKFSLGLTVLTALGLALAHAGSNLVNDYWDARHGIDSPDSPRVNYGPQAFVNGEFTKKQLLLGTGILLAAAAAIGLYLAYVAGPIVLAFMAGGAAILLFYSGDPFPLKYRGLGELAVLLVWGPLMVGGAYYIQTQTLPWWVLVASLPYALGVTTVLFGKHLDKVDFDAKNKTNTLVVLLGEKNARAVTRALVVLMYILPAALVAAGIFLPTALLTLLSAPLAVSLWKIFSAPKPKTPPPWAIGCPCILSASRLFTIAVLACCICLASFWILRRTRYGPVCNCRNCFELDWGARKKRAERVLFSLRFFVITRRQIQRTRIGIVLCTASCACCNFLQSAVTFFRAVENVRWRAPLGRSRRRRRQRQSAAADNCRTPFPTLRRVRDRGD